MHIYTATLYFLDNFFAVKIFLCKTNCLERIQYKKVLMDDLATVSSIFLVVRNSASHLTSKFSWMFIHLDMCKFEKRVGAVQTSSVVLKMLCTSVVTLLSVAFTEELNLREVSLCQKLCCRVPLYSSTDPLILHSWRESGGDRQLGVRGRKCWSNYQSQVGPEGLRIKVGVGSIVCKQTLVPGAPVGSLCWCVVSVSTVEKVQNFRSLNHILRT